MWPAAPDELAQEQARLAGLRPPPWQPGDRSLRIGGCWATFPRGLTGPGAAGDPAWAAAVVLRGGRTEAHGVTRGETRAAYRPGMLALRIGALLEQAVRALDTPPDVLLLDATGRDHPRRAGLAVQLGAVLDLPTVGVTHRPLLAEGAWPDDTRGAHTPLRVGDEVVAAWLRTRAGTRPLVVHPGWRTDLDTALEVVRRTTVRARTPEPLRRARHLARLARQQ